MEVVSITQTSYVQFEASLKLGDLFTETDICEIYSYYYFCENYNYNNNQIT